MSTRNEEKGTVSSPYLHENMKSELDLDELKSISNPINMRCHMTISAINILALSLALVTGGCGDSYSRSHNNEGMTTDAGNIDFSIIDHIKNKTVYQHINHVDDDKRVVELQDGSRWSVSKLDVVKGWEKSKNLVITQNHASFSTSPFALVNLDIKLAEPISLMREPTPSKSAHYVKNIISVNDIVTLNNDSKWVIHSSDRGKMNKMAENDRIVIGVNTGDDRNSNPYLLIDTTTNNFVRAQQLD